VLNPCSEQVIDVGAEGAGRRLGLALWPSVGDGLRSLDQHVAGPFRWYAREHGRPDEYFTVEPYGACARARAGSALTHPARAHSLWEQLLGTWKPLAV